jgi:hypothetical protein
LIDRKTNEEKRGGENMNPWELVFRQSRVNNGSYDGDRRPAANWLWPRDTWFQKRLHYLRFGNGRYGKTQGEKVWH